MGLKLDPWISDKAGFHSPESGFFKNHLISRVDNRYHCEISLLTIEMVWFVAAPSTFTKPGIGYGGSTARRLLRVALIRLRLFE